MSKKYLTAEPAAIVTNDLYLAAFLHCVGCPLDHLERNDRRRLSFVFVGERVRELREAYRTSKVLLDMRSFRESLSYIRRLMDGAPEQRSFTHASSKRIGTCEPANHTASASTANRLQSVAQC